LLHQRWAAAPQQPRTAEVWLALKDIRDPGNLGTIIRTVDAAGAAGVILVGTSCDPFSRDCVRATMGSLFNVPLVRIDDKAFAVLASQWPGDVIGTFMKAERDFRTSYRLPALIVMGSEGTGISPAITSLCTAEVRIPMAGKAESLNVAIASALILYEVRRAALK
jgi:TrmH family RNA methyltransferase